jgi:hypothetical protein
MRQQLPMIHIYYILLLIINIILATLYGPRLLSLIKRYFTRTKRKPSVDCVALEQRVKELEKKVNKRELNSRQAIRQEITNILIELKK